MEPTVSLAQTSSAPFDAAYDALMPYTQHAQVRANIAERVVTALRDYSRFAVVEVLLAGWPSGYTRLNRTVLTEVVAAAARALDEG
jgi:hypothetical protein